MSSQQPLPSADILRHVVDVHCHPTDSNVTAEAMNDLQITICAMSSRQSDQVLVRDLALAYPTKVIPCFGYHPWFSHWISLGPCSSKEEHYRRILSCPDAHEVIFECLLSHLPDPISLADVLAELRRNLDDFPQAMLGEVGLDRAARIPVDHFSRPSELTPFTIPLQHQLTILEAQIDLAVELGRNISMHSVKSPQATSDLFDRMRKKHGARWLQISIDLHSCGISPETWRAIEKRHVNVFMSLSTVINGRSPNHRTLIAACSPRRILVESDIAEIKGWLVESTWEDVPREEDWGIVRRFPRSRTSSRTC